MSILKQRKRLLKIRKISDTIGYTNKVCRNKIIQLNESTITNCSCPICKSKEYVTYKGTNRGMRKYICNNPFHGKGVWFSTSTSYEAMEIYREVLTDNLGLLVLTNSKVNGIISYKETTKHFVEFAIEGLYEFITQNVNKPIIKIGNDDDLVTVFLDISGSGLAKNKAIILAKIGENIIFEIVTTSNHLSSHNIISAIQQKLEVPTTAKVVFITDGELCFVDSIRHFFPNAIHIRQFHARSCKGIIYIHFPYKEKLYTIRCLWDAVLNEGIPSIQAIRKREYKAKIRMEDKEHIKKRLYSELSTEVMIWEDIIYEPRGVRRLLSKKKITKKSISEGTQKKKTNTSGSDTPKLIFQGELKKAMLLDVMAYCFAILKRIFGGLYITTNIVETIFNFKSKLYPHRAMKFGNRMLVCILYSSFILKDKNKQEIIKFLRENVITYDFILNKVMYPSGLQKNKIDHPSYHSIIEQAIHNGKKLIIHYCDAYHKHTSRVIIPIAIKQNTFNNTAQVESYCELRKENRTFYLDRIRDIAIYDPEAICL